MTFAASPKAKIGEQNMDNQDQTMTEPPESASQAADVDLHNVARRQREDLRRSIANAINMVSAENGSDTPDFILAEYLLSCLAAYDATVCAREKWYGRECGLLKSPLEVGMPPSRRDLENNGPDQSQKTD